jgi:tetratricopeptide (TPR) repeat protein
MGVLTVIGPDWLEDLSHPGRNVEAITIKNAGDNYLKSGKYGEAIQQYSKAIKIVPDLKSAIANLAIAYQKTGNFKKAIVSFNQLLKLKPEYPDVIYYNLGDIYEKTGQIDKALENYILASETSAFPEKSYQKAGHIFMENKDWINAIVNFKLAIDNRRSLDNSYIGMLITNQKAHNDTSNKFIEIEKILADSSYLSLFGNYDEQIFNSQLSTDIDLAKTYNNTGYCLAMIERYNESQYYLKTAIRIYPSYTEAKNNLKVVESFLEKKEIKTGS